MAVRSVAFELAATDADEKEDGDDLLDVALKDANGESLHASMMFKRPSAGQFGRLSIAFGRASGFQEMMPAIDHFLMKIIVRPSDVREIEGFEEREDFVGIDWIWDLVEDEEKDFGLVNVMDLIKSVVKEFSGFPTKSSSGSASSQKAPGRSSTAGSRRAGSTRSRSISADSAT